MAMTGHQKWMELQASCFRPYLLTKSHTLGSAEPKPTLKKARGITNTSPWASPLGFILQYTPKKTLLNLVPPLES